MATAPSIQYPELTATVDDGAATIDLSLRGAGWALFAGNALVLEEGERTIGFDEVRRFAWSDLALRGPDGIRQALPSGLGSGELFAAVDVATPDQFFERVQLNHNRFRSPFMLELAARLAFGRFPDHFEVRAAALTIMAHRVLERPVGALNRIDKEQIAWIVGHAETLVASGEERIYGAGDKPFWQHVRWTVSLATVAGYLSLIDDRTERAEAFFAVCVRHVSQVRISRVSALNLVNGCFVHGLLSAALGHPDDARTSFTTAIRSLPEMVGAQDLMANVWVIGDLLNVMRSARQCYIGLVCLRLTPPSTDAGPPVIDQHAAIDFGQIKGPLKEILAAGCAPELMALRFSNRPE